MAYKKLYRDIEHGSIGGVSAGLADFFDMDVTILRVLFVITAIFGGGVVLYIILWIVVPPKQVTPVAQQGEVVSDTQHTDQKIDTTPTTEAKIKDNKNKGLTGGIILIVIGLIFLVNVFADFRFRDLWPILIITIGVIVVASGFINKKN